MIMYKFKKGMYSVQQTSVKKRFLLRDKKIVKKYSFDKYVDALRFAVNEQIKTIYVQPYKDSKLIKRSVFTFLYTLPQFKVLAKKNPMHFVGLQSSKDINIERYYFYLVNSTNILCSSNKLRKFMEF